MKSIPKISFFSAVIININIMLGAGLFVNTATVAHKAGSFGFVGYALSGLLLFPLILCFAELMRLFPQGGFYGYAATVFSPFVGFINSWSYFFGKLASAALTLHTAVMILQHIIPPLNNLYPLTLDGIILAIFITLNMYNVKTGSKIQSFFMGAKLIPLMSIIFGSIWLFKGTYFSNPKLLATGLPAIFPIVLYATIGFEAAVSLCNALENPEKNGPRAIITSYSIVITLACLYQAFFYGALGTSLQTLSDFRTAFSLYFETLLGINNLTTTLTTLVYIAIASSALGGCYGILFSNHWNLYRLATHNHLFKSDYFKRLNSHNIPFICIIAEGIICMSYLYITQATLTFLQQISGLGTVLTYTISVLTLMITKIKRTPTTISWPIVIIGFLNCMILVTICVSRLLQESISSFITFLLLMLCGCGMFFLTNLKRNKRTQT